MSGDLAKATCNFCGWTGDVSDRPRKILMPESYERWDMNLDARREGRVLTIRFDEAVHPTGEIRRVLGLASFSSSKGVARLVLAKAPDETVLLQLRAIPGVREVR